MEERKPSLKSKSSIGSNPLPPKSVKKESKPKVPVARINPFVLRENKIKRKRKPAANILFEIQKLQRTTENLLPVAPFQRLVR